MYRMPTSESIRNLDTRTIGTVVNQTTAIRIDDSTVDVRKTWSSKKINESKADSATSIIDNYTKSYGELYLSSFDPHYISQWQDVIYDAQKETEEGKPFLIPWNQYTTVQVIKADLDADEKIVFFYNGRTWAMTENGIHTIDTSRGNAKVTIHSVEEWNELKNYVPERGEACIYADRIIKDGVPYPGIKIGDGNSHVIDLPFFGDDKYEQVLQELETHILDENHHVSAQDRAFWNNKLNYTQVGEVLSFNRL